MFIFHGEGARGARTSEGGFFRRRQISRRRLIAQGGAATAAGLGFVAVGADPAQAAAAVMYTGDTNAATGPTELFAPLPGDSALHVDNNDATGVAIEATSQGIGIAATGKKVPLLLNPGTTTGPPPGDDHVRGEVYVDVFGRIWHCIAPATPSWVRPGFNPISPMRIVDTRAGAKIGPGQSLPVTVIGSPAIPVPVGATAVAGTFTMLMGTLNSWGIAYADGEPTPVAANLNYVAGTIGNAFCIAKLGTNGKIRLFNKAGAVHFIFDLAGFFF